MKRIAKAANGKCNVKDCTKTGVLVGANEVVWCSGHWNEHMRMLNKNVKDHKEAKAKEESDEE